MQALLTLPHLVWLEVGGLILRPNEPIGSPCQPVLPLAPLSSFKYALRDIRESPRSTTGETDLLAIILQYLAASLEKLFLPSESASLATLHQANWPKLRELTLRGEVSVTADSRKPSEPYIVLLEHTPKLRALALELFLPSDVHHSPSPVWPPGCNATYPWPDLESLTLSHLHVDDELYRHLPPTLTRLALCCFLYHLHRLPGAPGLYRRMGWQRPLLTSSQLLRILSQCSTPHLVHLEIEYSADKEEMALLRFLPHAFPELTSLMVHIYRLDCEHEQIPVESIARALSPLSHLRTLRMYLGFKESRTGLSGMIRGVMIREPSGPEHDILQEAINCAAQVFANLLTPSLETLCLY
ncbi:hypothetical protein BV20DRAFT_1101136 [Pilatotrama ljubarskyi]|nr:hypothetical protein BV20DRAFT_1101136 [Pilatotrama ljubarskyi]